MPRGGRDGRTHHHPGYATVRAEGTDKRYRVDILLLKYLKTYAYPRSLGAGATLRPEGRDGSASGLGTGPHRTKPGDRRRRPLKQVPDQADGTTRQLRG